MPATVPGVAIGGCATLDPAVVQRARQLRQALLAGGGEVAPVAMLRDPAALQHAARRLDVVTLDYAEQKALRERDGHVPLVSAMGLLVAPDRRTVVMHRRAANAEFYPGALQGVGGTYSPPAAGEEHDGLDLRRTLRREICEELGLTVDETGATLVLMRERDLGSILLAFAGCVVTRGLDLPDVDRSEGDLCCIGFDRLEAAFTDEAQAWAPSGRATVLAWLASGAPGAGRDVHFGGARPQQLFRRLLRA